MMSCYCTQKHSIVLWRLTKVSFHNQAAAFAPKAIDLAARELTSLATPGQGTLTLLYWLISHKLIMVHLIL